MTKETRCKRVLFDGSKRVKAVNNVQSCTVDRCVDRHELDSGAAIVTATIQSVEGDAITSDESFKIFVCASAERQDGYSTQ
jgi:hypothetical protein